jgi:hypothetical protein
MSLFLELLSPTLKSKVMHHIFCNAFKRNTVFNDHKEIIALFIKDVIPNLRKPDDIIIEQGGEAFHFYFIAEGQCSVSLMDYKK